MNDIIHFIFGGILSKIVDDLYDEEIYKECFPNANIFFKFIIIIHAIYMFYFKSTDSTLFLFIFLSEIGFLTFLFFRFLGWNNLSKIAEINPTLDDPFTLLSIVLLPNFIIHFYTIMKQHYILLLLLYFIILATGVIQDVDDSLFGTYILKNKFNNTPHKKKYKLIYRLIWIMLIGLYNYLPNELYKNMVMFSTAYNTTSVCSLYLQIMLEENKEHKIFIEKLNNIKTQLTQNNILN
jgi:hypothetical protein